MIRARGLQVHAAGWLAGFFGLRVGEVAGLLWSDLDLARGFFTVTRTIEAGRVVPKKDGTQMSPSTLKSQWWNWLARQKIDPHLPIHGLRDSFGTWVYETYGVKQAQEWLGHSDPATTLRHYVRLTTAARAKAVAGLDEVTRAALEAAQEKVLEEAQPLEEDVVSLASCRR